MKRIVIVMVLASMMAGVTFAQEESLLSPDNLFNGWELGDSMDTIRESYPWPPVKEGEDFLFYRFDYLKTNVRYEFTGNMLYSVNYETRAFDWDDLVGDCVMRLFGEPTIASDNLVAWAFDDLTVIRLERKAHGIITVYAFNLFVGGFGE